MNYINFNNKSPIYLQIANYFVLKVLLGELIPGSLIPSRRDLAGQFGVNLNTVQKAYSYMNEIGLIVTERNKGSMITHDITRLKSLKEDYIKEPLINFISSMKSANISKEITIDLVNKYYDMEEVEYDKHSKSK
nr:GntR family transcriptional regulator [uncultured Peptostreptococcus sp.]